MMQAQKDKQSAGGGDKAGAASKKSTAGTEGNDARKEMTKTKEQLEEEKKIALSIRIKPLELDAMDTDDLKAKATELFNIVIQLETDKYDYEQKRQQQERDLQELKERQKAQLRQKALKKGLDPEALVGKYPPMIRMYSKYERRTDTRTYEDRKKLYEGGWEVIRAESLDAIWKEKFEEWSKRPSKKLPKWFGERPGKKAGDAPTPEGEEDGGEEAAAEEEDYEEEEEEEEGDDDGDGVPDAEDNDDDNDGIPDSEDMEGGPRTYSFGFGYGCTWGSIILIFASVVLLICDRESGEIFYKERQVEEEEEEETGEA